MGGPQAIVALVRAVVEDICEISDEDGDELKKLKRLIKKNIPKRLVLSEDVVVASLLDPSTKDLDILGLTAEEKIDRLSNALHTTTLLSFGQSMRQPTQELVVWPEDSSLKVQHQFRLRQCFLLWVKW